MLNVYNKKRIKWEKVLVSTCVLVCEHQKLVGAVFAQICHHCRCHCPYICLCMQ